VSCTDAAAPNASRDQSGDDQKAAPPIRSRQRVAGVSETLVNPRQELERALAHTERHLFGVDAGFRGDAVIGIVSGHAVREQRVQQLGGRPANQADHQGARQKARE
jgi:hypothetical protein